MESLETRNLLAADFLMLQNPAEPMGVNDEGAEAPGDVMMIANRLDNGNRPGGPRGSFDVNGGGQLAPVDALMPNNRLARPDRGERPGGNRPPVDGTEVEAELSIDGTGNNLDNPDWGSTGEQLLRLTTVEYADGVSSPVGEDRPSAREISNAVAAQDESIPDSGYLTDISWLWGQFIDHDIDLTENATDEDGNPLEPLPIDVPTGDPYFDPFGTGEATIGFNRSYYDDSTGDSESNPRQQINAITAFLDGSVIYGSDEERAAELRTFVGGKLKTSDGDLLPFNEAGLDNAGGTSSSLFLAGDVRANENVALSAMQTVWVREHNNWAEQIAAEDASLTDEEIFQQARAIVIAELQAITFNEFLPALLGYDAIAPYEGYDASVKPGIANVFSTAAYRFGHSMLSSELLRLDNDGNVAEEGNLSLSDAFFAPAELVNNGIDSILLGAATQRAQEIDNQVVDDVRNFLFGPPGAGGFDLASLNIQRGRDHGLADYNQTRVDFGLDPVQSFSEITSDPELAAQLEELYGDVDNIDLWVGGLAEDHVPGSNLGELFTTIIADQFTRIRDGDANWYQEVFSGGQLAQIEGTTLSDVIERNTEITGLRDNVFYEDSVLYFHAEDRQAANVALVVTQDQIELVNQRSGDLIDSRGVDEVSEVHLIGSNSAGDQFTIDLRQADANTAESIVVNGGEKLRNSIAVLSSPNADEVVVDGNQLTVNGTTIDYLSIDLIRWLSGPREDSIEVIAEGEARLVVENTQPRPDRPAGPRNDRFPRRPNREETAGSEQRRGERSDSPRRVRPPRGPDAVDAIFTELGDPLADPFDGPPIRS